MIAEHIKQAIKIHGHSLSPNEACGLIVDVNGKEVAVPCKNIAENQKEFFELNPRDYLIASNMGRVASLYHTQENAKPSELDIAVSQRHKIPSIVYSWKFNLFSEINGDTSDYIKYIGREFLIGEMDCWTLIRDFYKNEYNIELGNYPRDVINWFEKTPTIVEDNYQKVGGRQLNDDEEMIVGDVLVFKMAHFGIYLGPDMFLHHPNKKLSLIEPLTKLWADRVSLRLRHIKRDER